MEWNRGPNFQWIIQLVWSWIWHSFAGYTSINMAYWFSSKPTLDSCFTSRHQLQIIVWYDTVIMKDGLFLKRLSKTADIDKFSLTSSVVVSTPFFLSLLQLAMLPEWIRSCDADANLSPLSIMGYYTDSWPCGQFIKRHGFQNYFLG